MIMYVKYGLKKRMIYGILIMEAKYIGKKLISVISLFMKFDVDVIRIVAKQKVIIFLPLTLFLSRNQLIN
jgi:hypothetical protein